MNITQQQNETLLLYQKTLENLDEMLQKHVISRDDYAASKAEALEELTKAFAGLEGFDVDDIIDDEDDDIYDEDDDDAEYSRNNGRMANFSADRSNTRFGAAILELGTQAGYTDVEELAVDIADRTQNTPENIMELLAGEVAPNNELAFHLAELFGLDGDYAVDLVVAGYEARGDDPDEFLSNVEAAIEEDGEDDGDYEDEEDEEDAQYSKYSNAKIRKLEAQIANFQQQLVDKEADQLLRDAISERESKAKELKDSGNLPPAVYNRLFSANFSTESEKIAAFSRASKENGVSLEASLHGIDMVLDIFESVPMAMFKSYVDPTQEERYSDEDSELDADIELQMQYRNENNYSRI